MPISLVEMSRTQFHIQCNRTGIYVFHPSLSLTILSPCIGHRIGNDDLWETVTFMSHVAQVFSQTTVGLRWQRRLFQLSGNLQEDDETQPHNLFFRHLSVQRTERAFAYMRSENHATHNYHT
jgi:hypothetical protein